MFCHHAVVLVILVELPGQIAHYPHLIRSQMFRLDYKVFGVGHAAVQLQMQIFRLSKAPLARGRLNISEIMSLAFGIDEAFPNTLA